MWVFFCWTLICPIEGGYFDGKRHDCNFCSYMDGNYWYEGIFHGGVPCSLLSEEWRKIKWMMTCEKYEKKQANKLFGCCPACVAYLEYAQPCVGLNQENGVSFYQWGEFASFRVGFLEKVVVNFVPDAQLQRHRERCRARRWLSAQLCGRHCWVALQFKGGHLRQDYEKKDHRVWVVLGKGLDISIKLWTFGIGGVFPFYKFNEKLPIEGQNNQSCYVQNTSLLYRDGAGWGGGC